MKSTCFWHKYGVKRTYCTITCRDCNYVLLTLVSRHTLHFTRGTAGGPWCANQRRGRGLRWAWSAGARGVEPKASLGSTRASILSWTGFRTWLEKMVRFGSCCFSFSFFLALLLLLLLFLFLLLFFVVVAFFLLFLSLLFSFLIFFSDFFVSFSSFFFLCFFNVIYRFDDDVLVAAAIFILLV